MSETDQAFLKPADAARYIDVSTACLAAWRFRKIILPFTVLHGTICYERAALDSYLSSHTITPGQPTPPGIVRRKGGTGRPPKKQTGVELSLVGCFTHPGFLASFTGRGSAGSGFLSRCIFSYSDRVPHAGDWAEIDSSRINKALARVSERLRDLKQKLIVEETPEARLFRLEAEAWIETLDNRYKARLASHMRRDLILRAIFSDEGTIDADKVRRAKRWIENQFANRFSLWPEDAGSAVERMESLILTTLEKRGVPLSERILAHACNTRRLGSGGFDTFRRAMTALIGSHQIVGVGKTRKGFAMYAIVR